MFKSGTHPAQLLRLVRKLVRYLPALLYPRIGITGPLSKLFHLRLLLCLHSCQVNLPAGIRHCRHPIDQPAERRPVPSHHQPHREHDRDWSCHRTHQARDGLDQFRPVRHPSIVPPSPTVRG